MAEYIEREAAIKEIYRFDGYLDDDMIWRLHYALREIPAADVVEVVRCKDCRYLHNGYDEKCCINHKGVVATDENGFCHHAERRADNG